MEFRSLDAARDQTPSDEPGEQMPSGSPDERLKLLIISSMVDSKGASEAYLAFKWIEALASKHDVTLLTHQFLNRQPVSEQLPHVRVVTWPEPSLLRRFKFARHKLKLGWWILSLEIAKWIRERQKAGEHFDIAHQIYPGGLRHSSPLRLFDIPYLIGPVAGMLPVAKALRPELGYSYLLSSKADEFRVRFDPVLRQSFERATAIVGVADYVWSALAPMKIKRPITILESAREPARARTRGAPGPGGLKLLHVGRAVRYKGLRDVVRAMAELKDLPDLHLTSVGDGPDLAECKREAVALGVSERITFRGFLPKEEVEGLYEAHDLFVFPSFREPMGTVFFEAMRWGLPIIATRAGGPAAIFQSGGAILVEPADPRGFAQNIAAEIRHLYNNPHLLENWSRAASERYGRIGSWSDLASNMSDIYLQILRRPQGCTR